MASVYDIITARVVEQLESGTVPWRKPWSGPEAFPRNAISRKPYRGINAFLLGAAAYSSPAWITYKQAEAAGGNVRKGERGLPVVFWNWLEKIDVETGQPIRVPFLRYYTAFNVQQCDGLPADLIPAPPAPRINFEPIAACQAIFDSLPLNRPTIEHGHPVAFYRPSADLVGMPQADYFDSAEDYYSTLFHELTHATGHESRLARKGITETALFGSATYSREELVAEMGAAFLCGLSGIDSAPIQQNEAAYIASWLRVLRADSKLVVTAAAQAQKAVDWLTGQRFDDQEGGA